MTMSHMNHTPPLPLTRALLLAALLGTGPSAMAAGQHDGGHDPTGENRHVHSVWVEAPPRFASLQGGVIWYDDDASERGGVLYARHCQMCHGLDGKGDGVVAATLDHKPSDLTQHRHSADGRADGYLFWRVSEGGTVSPFAEQNSMMPAFAGTLTEEQRWDTLAFIHRQFHGGFTQARASGSMDMTNKGMAPMGGDHTEAMSGQ